MPLVDIKNQITSESLEEKKRIISEAEKEVRRIMTDILKKKAVIEEEDKKETEKLLDKSKQKHLSILNRETRVRKESLKREILENLFSKTLKELYSSSDASEKFFKKSMKSLPAQVEGEIIVPNGSTGFFEKNIPASHNLSVKESSKVKGGFIISGRDFGYDFTFDSILEKEKASLELELSKILFS